jgi:hypothetical protein
MTVETVDETATVRSSQRRTAWYAAALLGTFGVAALAWTQLPSSPARLATSASSVHASLGERLLSQPASTPAPPADPAPSPVASAAPPAPPPRARAKLGSTDRAGASAAPAAPREYGALHVGSTPVWASVTVDGRSVGATPIAGLRLSAGTHSVEARPLGKAPAQRRVVRIPASGSASVQFRFEAAK